MDCAKAELYEEMNSKKKVNILALRFNFQFYDATK